MNQSRPLQPHGTPSLVAVPWELYAAMRDRVGRALDLYDEHQTATPTRPDGTPYRCECVGCQMARVLTEDDE